jgi:hypothetical protein
MAGTLPGSKHGEAIKDPEMRKKAYASYCAHLAKGKDKRSWWFEQGGVQCTYRTIESYVQQYPTMLDAKQIELSMCKGYQEWEAIAEDSAKGKNKKANTASLQMVMRNKFGWDKQQQQQQQRVIIEYGSGLSTENTHAPQIPMSTVSGSSMDSDQERS